MTIEETIKYLILAKCGSVKEFAKEIELPYTTVSGILKRGILNSNAENILKICDKLNVDVGSLIDGNVKIKSPDSNDISAHFEFLRCVLSDDSAHYNGLVLDDHDKEYLLNGLEFLEETIKRKYRL